MKNTDGRKREYSRVRITRILVRLGLGLGMLAMLQACPETKVVTVPVPQPVPAPAPPPEPAAQPAPVERVEVPVPGCDLVEFDEGQTFLVEVWAVPDQEFAIGEPLRLQLRTSSSSYMNIFHVSTSCKVTRLLHNHAVKATEIIDFPLRDSGIEIVVKPPEGLEGFYIVASRSELAFLAEDDILRSGSGIAALDLYPEQFYQRLEDMLGRVNPADWSVTTLFTSVGPWPNAE